MSKELKTVLIFAGVFVVMSMFAAYFVSNTMDEVEAKEAEIEDMNTKIDKAKKIAKQEEGLDKELKSLQDNLSQYVKILPSPEVATQERLMELVQERCDRTQFKLVNFIMKDKKKRRSKKKKRKGGFNEVDLTLSAEGTYDQFLRFLNSLERHESFLRVNTFNCDAGAGTVEDEDGNEILPIRITLNVSTFRYESGTK